MATRELLARHNERVIARLQKILSAAGVASRRASEQIALGPASAEDLIRAEALPRRQSIEFIQEVAEQWA